MVAVILIRKDKKVDPLCDGDGFLSKWPTVREAREHVDAMKLEQTGARAQMIGLHDEDDPE